MRSIHTYLRLLAAVIVATVAMAAATSSAFGTGIAFTTASTAFTANPITLRDSSLGNQLWGMTLTAAFASGTLLCRSAGLLQIGTVTAVAVRVLSPAGYIVAFRPFGLFARCVRNARGLFEPQLSIGDLALSWLGVAFTINMGLLGTFSYTGSAGVSLAAGGTRTTGVTSGFTSDRGTTMSFTTPWSFAASPAVAWRLVLLPDLS